MKEFKIELPKGQKTKLETILWLTNPMGPRGSGRTYLLALSFIMHSLNYRTWVTIYNHDTHHNSKQELLSQIERIVYSITGATLKIKNMHRNKPEILVEPAKNHIYNDSIYDEIEITLKRPVS